MKALVAISISLALLLVICLGALQVRAKLKYDTARRDDSVTYSVTPMDKHTTAFLADVESNWVCWVDATNAAEAEIFTTLGETPTVRHLIELFNYQMPPFRWFSPSENRRAALLNLMKAEFMPVSIDKKWHVSADSHAVFLLCKTNVVLLYRDEPTGLRASSYYMKKGAVMPPNTALEPTPTAP